MKAAVCREFGKPLVIEEVELDPPGKGEVKIKVQACAICHSDIHSFKGEHGRPPLPGIGGHEVCGVVEEIGEGVTYVKKGDSVVATLIPAGCGTCYYCSIGLSNQCTTNYIKLAQPGKYTTRDGKRPLQFAGSVAGFVEYTTVPETNIVKVPRDMRIDSASLLGCGVISGFGAVVNRAKAMPGKSLIVMGCGGVGLNAIQGAVYSGCYPIIAVDVLDNKLEQACQFGATHTINVKKVSDPIAVAREYTFGRGADYVIVAVAGLPILRQGFMMSAVDGTTVVIGHGFGEQLTDFAPTDFMMGRHLTGSAMGATRIRIDIPWLIELYKNGRYKLDELVSGHYTLDQINEAIASMERGEAVRNVIMF
jgi:Zn-dependent alcohol dehydrogenase